MDALIHLLSDKLYYTGVRLDNPHHIDVPKGVVTVIGANGAGKSTLAHVLEKGWNFRTNRIAAADGSGVAPKPGICTLKVKSLEFSSIYTLAGAEYYQQRYESSMNDEVLTVADIVGADIIDTDEWRALATAFHLPQIADRRINFLSSGELRKLLIIKTILRPVDLLILDNPYIGLDRASRDILTNAITDLWRRRGITVMMLVANPEDIHPATNCVIPMSNMQVLKPIEVTDDNLKAVKDNVASLFDYAVDVSAIPPPPAIDNEPLESVVQLVDCDVTYGSRTIIRGVTWSIDDGCFWALTGPNGSGKSTLLSLICADNPQAYRNNITLFGRRRGSGESIWDIKRRIAFISPEMVHHFKPSISIDTIIAQGLNDTSGAFIAPKPDQLELARRWMRLLHLDSLADRAYSTLSSGEQRMVLLARTFIKQARLMILDEPMHGLDYARARAVRAIINNFAARAKARPDRYPMSMIFVSHYTSEMPECLTFTKTLSAPLRQ